MVGTSCRFEEIIRPDALIPAARTKEQEEAPSFEPKG